MPEAEPTEAYVKEYQAKVLEVHDGDTYLLDIDLGFYTHTQQWLRLRGVDTGELHAESVEEREEAFAAREYVRDLIEGQEIEVRVGKLKWTFRRFVADVRLADGRDLAQVIAGAGFATGTKLG